MTACLLKHSILDKNILCVEFYNINKNNALSLIMLDELIDLLAQKNLEKKYKVIVFKGYKDTPFSSGADLNDIKYLKKENDPPKKKTLKKMVETNFKNREILEKKNSRQLRGRGFPPKKSKMI